MPIFRYILLRMRNVLDKSRTENQNPHSVFSNFFPKQRRLWGNVKIFGGARGATNDVTIWRIRVECWISKATRAHANTDKYVLFIAFPRQQLFANVFRCYLIRALSVLFKFSLAPWNIQGGSTMTGTNCDLFTHKSSRSYLNHLVIVLRKLTTAQLANPVKLLSITSLSLSEIYL
jgi:hypothetical protein